MNNPNQHYGLRESDIPLLESVQQGLMAREVRIPDWRETDPGQQHQFRDQVRHLLMDQVPLTHLNAVTERLADALSGIGLLQPFLRQADVEEIYVRGRAVAVERSGRLEHLGDLAPEAYWSQLIYRIADLSGQSLDPRHPAVLVDLPGGERFTGMLPPLMDAPAINIRLFGRKRQTLPGLQRLGAFETYAKSIRGDLDDIREPGMRAGVAALPARSPQRFLAWMVAAQAGNILFAGEFSSGKTTLLNAASQHIPPDAPVAILETFRELQLSPDLFQMRAIAPAELRPGQEETATMDWVLNVVYTRTNPAAIVLGEIVSSGEAMQFIKAANLGRRAYATIHGASVLAALGRLEQLALGDQPEMGLAAVRQMVASGVDVVVLTTRQLHPGGAQRFVSEVVHVAGIDGRGKYLLDRLYCGWQETGMVTAARNLIAAAWEKL